MWTQIRLLLLIWVNTICAKSKFEKFARRCSRRHKQTTFSDADFLGALRVNNDSHHFRWCMYRAERMQTGKSVDKRQAFLILKTPITAEADDSFIYCYFSKKISLGISCASSARQKLHMKCQHLISVKKIKQKKKKKKKKKNRLSSAANFAWHF